MNHYQKLATVAVRAAGISVAALGFVGLIYASTFLARGVSFTPLEAQRFIASFWYIGVGILVFVLGRQVGRLLGRGLE